MIRTTVVGSWWLHPEHVDDLQRFHAGALTRGEADSLLNQVAAKAIDEQRSLGLDEWTGGEYQTRDFVVNAHECLTGLEIVKEAEEYQFDYDDGAVAKIVGAIEAPEGLGYAAAYGRERALPGGVRKASVISPNELLVCAIGDPEALGKQMPALIAIVNRELRALADAGCPTVQLDAPMAGTLVNAGIITAKQAADLIAACLAGVEARKSVHICNGNMRGRPSSGVLRSAPWVEILQQLDGVVDVAMFEAKYFTQYLERNAFRGLPRSMEFAAGIVDEASYAVEPVKKIRARIADWARVVGEERLWVSPSCGFGRHSPRDLPVLRAKVENMVEAARTL